ncbi:GNAT family N-acetyltransferase [Arthrobacter pityocampae]|uniref:GNAT family N-acetyltransferase n=1 Tax=Arthrobacter pityocampae TaxID=547334 RepID=A0A2S5J2J7_9MICC|nr:GNAT family N-acetyltransferase [Arthrobacter pityocampae]PPB50970.1 GNAT family N-acetyltransferase [Arthrobacter pityocampae]
MDQTCRGAGVVVLETDRLVLRRWRVSDAAVQRRLWTERDPRVPPHRRIDAEGRPTLEEIEDGIRRDGPDASLGLLAVERRGSGDVFGYCGLLANNHGQDGEPELAFELLRGVWGQGYATEASQAVMRWAEELGHRRLWATVRDWNSASRAVMAKLGFVETARVERDALHGESLFFVKDLSGPSGDRDDTPAPRWSVHDHRPAGG